MFEDVIYHGHPKVPCFLEAFCYIKTKPKSIPLGVLVVLSFFMDAQKPEDSPGVFYKLSCSVADELFS